MLKNWISKIGDKLGERILGRVIVDFGTLPTNQHGWTVSIALRQQRAKHPDLVFKWQNGSDTTWQSLEASPEIPRKLEEILHETRREIEKPSA